MLKDFDLVNGSERREDVSKAEIILCWPTTLGGIVEFTGPNLKVIQPFSAGVDDLPYDKIPESVQIFSNAGAYSQSVAEHALALVLALSKNVGRKDPPESYEIARKTIVILGAGEIGSTVAKMMWDGFTCRTVGISRSFKHPENFDEVLSPSHLDDALGAADIMICALPLNKYTRNMLRYEKLSKMKKKVVIANVGRAEAINEHDIYRLLEENPDARFGTDVFWRTGSKENFESRLWKLPNFTGTYHRAGATASPAVKERAMEIALTNVRDYLQTGSSRNLVRREDYI